MVEQHEDENLNFSVDVGFTSLEFNGFFTATATETLEVGIAAVADPPELTKTDTQGNEDTQIPIIFTASTPDIDGSESLTEFELEGLVPGSTISYLRRNRRPADGIRRRYEFRPGSDAVDRQRLAAARRQRQPDHVRHLGPELQPSGPAAGACQRQHEHHGEASPRPRWSRPEDGDIAVESQTVSIDLIVQVDPQADIGDDPAGPDTTNLTLTAGGIAPAAVIVGPQEAIIDEDTQIQLTVNADFADLDGSESHELVISVDTTGWSLDAAGEALGWTANAAGDTFMRILPSNTAANFNGDHHAEPAAARVGKRGVHAGRQRHRLEHQHDG